MSNKGTASSNKGTAGIRAAKDLLELLDKHSAEELEAAVAILGNQQELVDILQLLTHYKQKGEEPDPKIQRGEHLTDVVRTELL